jgi:hypothetical protein
LKIGTMSETFVMNTSSNIAFLARDATIQKLANVEKTTENFQQNRPPGVLYY